MLQVTRFLLIATEWPEITCFNYISTCYCWSEIYFMVKTFVVEMYPWEINVTYLKLAFRISRYNVSLSRKYYDKWHSSVWRSEVVTGVWASALDLFLSENDRDGWGHCGGEALLHALLSNTVKIQKWQADWCHLYQGIRFHEFLSIFLIIVSSGPRIVLTT